MNLLKNIQPKNILNEFLCVYCNINVYVDAFSVQYQQTVGATAGGESGPRPRSGGDQEALQGTEDQIWRHASGESEPAVLRDVH